MNIGIISYNIPHKKTRDLANSLPKNYNVTIFQFPFIRKKQIKKINEDRPNQLIKDEELKFKKSNLNFLDIKDWTIDSYKYFKKEANNLQIKYFLLATSKIIPKYFLNDKFEFINCHPAKLPNSRGVDAFKWSILKNIELGNTLHIIDKNIDSGYFLFFKKLKVFKNDNFTKVCNRMYRDEIKLMSNFINYINFKKKINTKNHRISHKRIDDYNNFKIDKIFKLKKKNFY